MKRSLVLVLSLTFLTQCSNANNQQKPSAAGQRNSNQPAVTNEQTIRWDKYSISFRIPADWTKDDSLSQEEKRGNKTIDGLVWRGSKDQRIEFLIETSDTEFPVSSEAMLAADYESSKSGPVQLEDVRYLDVNGVKGLYYRRPLPDDGVNATWLTYRQHKGRQQSIVIILGGLRKDLEHLNSILSSVKLENEDHG